MQLCIVDGLLQHLGIARVHSLLQFFGRLHNCLYGREGHSSSQDIRTIMLFTSRYRSLMPLFSYTSSMNKASYPNDPNSPISSTQWPNLSPEAPLLKTPWHKRASLMKWVLKDGVGWYVSILHCKTLLQEFSWKTQPSGGSDMECFLPQT